MELRKTEFTKQSYKYLQDTAQKGNETCLKNMMAITIKYVLQYFCEETIY